MDVHHEILAAICLLIFVICAGCGGHFNLTAPDKEASPLITITGPQQVRLNGTAAFTAAVIGENNPAVTWSVQPPAGTAASAAGSISSAGVYTAPPVGDAPVLLTIVAASIAEPSLTASVQVQLLNPVPQIATATIAAGLTGGSDTLTIAGSGFLFTSTVTLGTTVVTPAFISASGLQVTLSPSMLGASQIPVAVNNPNPGAASSNIVNAAVPPSITITGPPQVRLNDTAAFTATVIGETNPAVTWSVQPPAGTAASAAGSISSAGVYTAPPVGDAPVLLTIVAASIAEPSLTASVQVQLLNPVPQIATATIAAGLTGGSDTLTIAGSGFLSASTVTLGSTTVITPVFLTSSSLQVALPSSMLATSQIPVTVNNPNPGAASSNIVNAAVPPSITITGPPQVRLNDTAAFTATVIGETNPAVTWSVQPPAGTAASAAGSISSAGVYTAPPVGDAPVLLTIVAASIAEPSLTASVQVQLLNPVPQIATATIVPGPMANYSIQVSGDFFIPTSEVYIGNRALPTTYLSAKQLTAFIFQPALTSNQAQISVMNSSDGGIASNSIAATVTPPPTSVLAATRLLDQATFGPTLEDIGLVQAEGISGYLQAQFGTPPSVIPAMSSKFSDIPAYCGPFFQCVVDGYWYDNILFGPDQLRQRVAFALSEIWVVSTDSVDPRFLPPYLNALTSDAFGNYRQLMEDITKTAAMGEYLNMGNNLVATSDTAPNQNFARELLQLFTIGLIKLNDDGSPILDANGNPIPTYSQREVVGLSAALTGWTYGNSDCSSAMAPNPNPIPTDIDLPGNNCPLSPLDRYHDQSSKTLLDGVVLPPGQTTEQDLKAALDNIFNNSSLPPFVCRQLIQHLVKSMPSSEYVNRVVQVFKDDGTGIRGNLQAVIFAILTDAEARAGDSPGGQALTDGHQREPILWLTANLRALHGVRTGELDAYQSMSSYMIGEESPHKAPSVFNYFSAQYVIPQTTINAPEYQLETSDLIVTRRNVLSAWILNNTIPGFTFDFSSTGNLAELAAAGPQNLIDWVNVIYFHGNMSSREQSILLGGLQGLQPRVMVATAIYVANTASDFTVIQ